ncbi:MAG: BF3164 family lipoprotein [Odoribacter sp.]
MKKITYIFLFAFFLGACTQEEATTGLTPYIKGANETLQVTKLLSLKDMGIDRATGLVKQGDLITIGDRRAANNVVSIDLNTNKAVHFFPRGRKMNEAVCINNLAGSEQAVTALDFQTGKLLENQTGPTTRSSEAKTIQLPSDKQHFSAVKAGDVVISTGMYEKGRYLLYTPEDSSAHYFLSYPEHPDYPNIQETTKGILYASSILKVRPDNGAFVCADRYSGIIDICRISGNCISRIRELDFHYPKVMISEIGIPDVTYYTTNQLGFTDVSVSNESIYAIYSGKTYRQSKEKFQQCSVMLQFNWEGNLIKAYNLGAPLTDICYDNVDKAIYGIAHLPESALIRIIL